MKRALVLAALGLALVVPAHAQARLACHRGHCHHVRHHKPHPPKPPAPPVVVPAPPVVPAPVARVCTRNRPLPGMPVVCTGDVPAIPWVNAKEEV